MTKYRPYTAMLTDATINWIKKSSTKMGIKRSTELTRAIMEDAMSRDIKELTQRFMQSRLQSELALTTEQLERAAQRKAELERQLEEVNA